MSALGACSSSTGGTAGDDTTKTDAPAPEMSATYHGTLAMSQTVPFGGVTYCAYSITLRQIDATITMRPSGEVTGAMVQALNVEATVGSCPYQPQPPSIANYALDSAKLTPTGSTLQLAGAPANAPMVALTIDVSPSSSGQQAMMTFQRTDQTGELAWTVKPALALAKN
ncbi:MAG TPA: hypothetical protein VFQ65_29755 [Kofleriaceae bacterium]|nr:hypothetical protein [Kofleriaceae bacterium]